MNPRPAPSALAVSFLVGTPAIHGGSSTTSTPTSNNPLFRYIFARVSDSLSTHDPRVTPAAVETLIATTAGAMEVLNAIFSGEKHATRLFFMLAEDPANHGPVTERLRILNTMTEGLGPGMRDTDTMHFVAVLRAKDGPIPVTGKEAQFSQDVHVVHVPCCTGAGALTLMLSVLDAVGGAGVRAEVEALQDTHRVTREISHGGFGLDMPSPSVLALIQDTTIGHQKASQDAKLVKSLEDVVEHSWSHAIRSYLDSRAVIADPRHISDDIGPMSELEKCENDLLMVECILEQLDNAVVRLIVTVLSVGKSGVVAAFQALRQRLVSQVPTIKDVMRYLQSLTKYFDIIHRGGSSTAAREMIPSFLQNVFLVTCASPDSYTTERLTVLFVKVANQLIHNCKIELRGGTKQQQGKLWDAVEDDALLESLLLKLRNCVLLCAEYKLQFRIAREHSETSTVEVRPLKLDDLLIFGKLNLFCKRIQKIIDIFSAVELFRTMRAYNLSGFDVIGDKFFVIVEDFQRKCADLLDYTKPTFDKEYIDFTRNVVELESTVQVHINSCFENNTSTLSALDMLSRFKKIFSNENSALRVDLSSKDAVILHNYGVELENVQKVYEIEKESPPTIRNSPPVAGPLLWARHLLHLIEVPMLRLQSLGILASNPRESKRVVRTYNALANALVQFELLWVQAWTAHVADAKCGLQATLLVQHNGVVLCNFDKDILEVIMESKWLSRIGVVIPPHAKSVLAQEKRIRNAERSVRGLLCLYNETLAMIHPVMRALMYPCIQHLRELLHPGETIILWTSLCLDEFCASASEGILNLRRVLMRINDVLENRVQESLRVVSTLAIIDDMEHRSLTMEQYLALQRSYLAAQLIVMRHKSKEMETAALEACDIARESMAFGMSPSSHDVTKVVTHFNRLMFKAVLNATVVTFQTLRRRINTTSASKLSFLANTYVPLFSTQLELSTDVANTRLHEQSGLHRPSSIVVLNPNVDEVQLCINQVITGALFAMKSIGAWDSLPDSRPFYDEIARNKEVVKVVLFLTGSVHCLRQQVAEYVCSLDRFQSLWSADGDEMGREWCNTQHGLHEYVIAFAAHHGIESDLKRVPPRVDIGALVCDNTGLIKVLLAEITAWKQHFAVSLHTHADTELEALTRTLDGTSKRLSHKITESGDLADVRIVFDAIKEIRTMEAAGVMTAGHIEAMYQTLTKFDMKINKEVHDKLTDFRMQWGRVRAMASDRTQEICVLQNTLRVDFMDSVKRFGVDILSFRNDFIANGPMVSGLKAADAIERLRKYNRLFGDRVRRWEGLQVGEELFGMPRRMYPELACTSRELDHLDRLYSLHVRVVAFVSFTMETLWCELQLPAIHLQMQSFLSESKKLPLTVRAWDAFKELKQIISDLVDVQPVLEQLCRPSIKERHWRAVMETCGQTWKLDAETFRLKHVVDAKLLLHKDDILDLATASDKENELEIKLRNVEMTWKDQVLTCADFKHRGCVVLKGDEVVDLKELLEETHLVLGSMMSSRYIGPFRNEVASWAERLTAVSETLDLWMEVQALWIYLEAVFSGGDIVKQLPQEAKRFTLIDKQWCKILFKANEVRNVMAFCYNNEVLNCLPYLKEQLELLQRQLASYLERKRTAFARFYFISDGVLLEILSQSSDPAAIQTHLGSMFDGIQRITLVPPSKDSEVFRITKLHAPEGETVELHSPVPCTGNVEDWLHTLCGAMRVTIRYIMLTAATEISATNHVSFREMLSKYPAQVVLTSSLIMWTSDVTHALSMRPGDRKESVKRMISVRDELTDIARGDLDSAARISVEGLVVLQVHNMDVWEVIKRCKDTSSFEFQRQLRAYWSSERNSCVICMTDVVLPYCYEYLGIKERLVMTGLTDRCYITLCQAIAIYMGGAPAGPAGTGKTETVKDLGRATGNYVVVFNCGDQMNFRAMGKIFKGLSQSGAWGCFDEFNRIDLPVLSVVAQQVLCLFTALKQRKAEFTFTDGTVCRLVPTTAIFVTMNPGYAGRQELPENLKALFRTVSMMVPERDAIMKVKLASAGYKAATTLSKKFFVLYSMCEHQLSKQHHYDFGLRNILSVLRSAGQALRSSTSKDEEAVFVRTLQEMNLSKLVHADIDLFLALVNDIFPGKMSDKPSDSPFHQEMRRQIEKMGFAAAPGWLGKCSQLNDTRKVRHGFMLVGPSGVGKSTCMTVTMATLSVMERRHKEMRMNPKAITSSQMFGRVETTSGDWYDGIFSFLWRKANKDKAANVWLVCDGPVDTFWIENLNTVLDDNKLLTLANGDRISMAPSVRICFEVEHLNHASPATVSRAGIIFVSEEELGWLTLPTTMIVVVAQEEDKEALPSPQVGVTKSQRDFLLDLYQRHGGTIYAFVKLEVRRVMNVSRLHHTVNSLYVLRDFMDQARKASVEVTPSLLEKFFWSSIVWSFGALLEAIEREKFNTLLVGLASKKAAWPIVDTVFEYTVCITKDTWLHWCTMIPVVNASLLPKTKSGSVSFSGLFIPTVESVRMHAYLQAHLTQRRPVLLVGSGGCSKTVTTENFLSRVTLNGGENGNQTWRKNNLSSVTTPNAFQFAVEDVIEKRMGMKYGPKRNAFLLFFVDDVSSPEVNVWGDQETSELLRQVLEMKGFYSLVRVGECKQLVDMYFLSAMAHPGSGRNDIPNRLKRQFSIVNLAVASNDVLKQIFGTIVESRHGATQLTLHLTELCISLWRSVQLKMLPTPQKFHYVFDLRDLTRICQGLHLPPKEVVDTDTGNYMLWCHEVTRVLADKLNDEADLTWFRRQLASLLGKLGMAKCADSFPPYVNFLRDMADNSEENGETLILYEPLESMAAAKERLLHLMRQHNETFKQQRMDLVMFDAAVTHILRLTRVLGLPQGSSVLVGVGGSGKQSVARLSAYVLGYPIFQPTVHNTYTPSTLLDDLRGQYVSASSHPSCFLLSENDIKNETFLEYINVALASGDVSGMFQADDKDNVRTEVRPKAKLDLGRDFVDSDDALWNYFIRKVRENLHFILCFSPMGVQFRERVRKFPSLMSCCTVDWFFPWPEEALLEVATRFLTTCKTLHADAQTKLFLAKHFAACHNIAEDLCCKYRQLQRRSVYSTPKSYLNFLDLYKVLYQEKYSQLDENRQALAAGLAKLDKAAEDVFVMKAEINAKEIKLAAAQAETDVLVLEITDATADAERHKGQVSAVKDTLSAEAAKVEESRAEAERDLVEAQPALESAKAALDQITHGDMKTLKAILKPPLMVRKIMDGVCILLGFMIDPVVVDMSLTAKKLVMLDSWGSCGRPLVVRMDFMELLMNFNISKKDEINDETCELLLPYLYQEDFTYERARSACGNVAGLCTWVRAMHTYHGIAKFVAPKIVALAESECKMKIAMSKLMVQQAQLDVIKSELYACQSKLEDARKRKRMLEEDAASTRKRMESAAELLYALGGEKARWTSDSQVFDARIRQLVGDVASAAAFITYGGCVNAEYRKILLQRTQDSCHIGVPHSENFSLQKFLISEQQVSEWQLQGLPADDHSTQNAIIVSLSLKSPMIIDPQGQGQNWLTTMLASEGLVVTQTTAPNFLDSVREQMREGRPLLLDKSGSHLDGVLDNVLERRVVRTGRSVTVVLNDQAHDYNAAFKLIFATQLANPDFDPELYAKTVVVDFTVTITGLEQQLLSRVVRKERAEYEIQRGNLLEEINANEKRLNFLEQKLLEKLSASDGKLIDDAGLISALSETKKASVEIGEKLQVAADTRRRINAARDEFMPVAVRGSVIYFTSAEMANVNSMYQTSLMTFIELFDASVDAAETSQILSQRIRHIVDRVTWDAFCAVGRGLYEADKKIFVLLLAIKVSFKSGHMTPLMLRSLLISGTALNTNDIISRRPKTIPFVTNDVWKNIVHLEETIPRFRLLSTCMGMSESTWRAFLTAAAPEEIKVPDYADLSPVESLVLIRALRFDRTLFAGRTMVGAILGDKFQDMPAFELEKVVSEASPFIPIVYLLSVGADPTSVIETLAKRHKKHVHVVSMGQGQEVEATDTKTAVYGNGEWLLVQNCHLGVTYLNMLEHQLDRDSRVGVNPEARLWLTTQALPSFPVTLLQRSIKLTNDPPQGIRAGMMRSLGWVTQDVLDTYRRPEWRCLLYTLCFLHSAVQERCRFGPIGWCVPYEFNYSDWYASMVFIQNHIGVLGDDPKKFGAGIGWDAVRFMISEIHYGGRVTDQRDRFVFIQFVEGLIGPNVTDPSYLLCPELHSFTLPPATFDARCMREHAGDQFSAISDSPAVVGLNANVDVTLRITQVAYTLETVLRVQPRTDNSSGSDGSTNRDATVRIVATELLDTKLPPTWPQHAIEQMLVEHGTRNPLMIVLSHEASRLSALIEHVRVNLQDVKLAVDGTLVITPAFAELMDALHDGLVPAAWRILSWESTGIGTWAAELGRRYEQLQTWHKKGTLHAFWLYGFFSPQAFLTSVRQSVARSHSWALDRVEQRCEITRFEGLTGPPSEGVYVSGLVLDGASWDGVKGRVREAPPNVTRWDLPLVRVTAALTGGPLPPTLTPKETLARGYPMRVPCYRTGARGDGTWIADVDMAVDDKAEVAHWVMRGVAILCSKT